MRIRQILAAVTVALFSIAMTACGKSQTPTEGFKAFYEAAKNKDVAALKKTISKKLLTDLENEAKREGKPFDDFLLGSDATPSMPEVRNEKIEGDKATLEVKGRGDTWRTTKLVKEDGTWKLDD
jgi:predicted lipid-binding transport protein (Tim44 family)